MSKYIKNKSQLLSHGHTNLREMAVQIIEGALEFVNPYEATRKLVHISGNKLKVGPNVYDLSRKGNIYVIGAGKASLAIARALEDTLGDRIAQGIVVVKKGQQGGLKRIKIIEAAHPIPDANGLRATKKVIEIANMASENDIVFSCITGGSSALLQMPVDSISLREKKKLTKLLLSCGASIVEINRVRKHISKIKGGRLGKSISPATLINLTVSDVINDPLDYITDPTVPDTSTFEDAMETLRKYSLLKKVPISILTHIEKANPSDETPKDFGSMSYHNFILANNNMVCERAAFIANSIGLKAMILSTMFEGESQEIGRSFGSIVKEIIIFKRPIAPPCVLIGGGETTVTLKKNFGKGGPNQEFVVSTALALEGINGFLVVGVDTDGTDGPTNFAGAMADSSTLLMSKKKKLDLYKNLKNHTVSEPLVDLREVIITGPTGTNVNDIKLCIVL